MLLNWLLSALSLVIVAHLIPGFQVSGLASALIAALVVGFVNGTVGDPEKDTQVLTCLSASSRAEVDAFKSKALAAGAREWKPNVEFGPMYGCSFQDINGHVWEMMHMAQG